MNTNVSPTSKFKKSIEEKTDSEQKSICDVKLKMDYVEL